jgi:hypothetical protein
MVAMPVVRMMQVAVHQVVDVIAMRDRVVSASGPVAMLAVMGGAPVSVRAGIGVRGADGNHVLVHMAVMRMMQMAVVQVVQMAFVAHDAVTAIGAVRVLFLVSDVSRHRILLVLVHAM